MTDEIERLRAELAAERDAKQSAVDAAEAYRDERNACIKEVAEAGKRQGQAEAERDALRAQLDAERETFVDAHGTTWLRPTAEAYYLVCKARDKHQSELAKERERADAHYRALENVTTKNERLTAERDALRAELAAEREKLATLHAAWTKERNKPVQLVGSAERDELRALLREAREELDELAETNDVMMLKRKKLREILRAIVASIDAALKGDGDG